MSVLQDFTCGRMRVRIFDTRAAMGACAGKEAADCVKQILREKETANVMFAAAPSQNETLSAFMDVPGIDWGLINAFHMDEYVGLDSAHPAGFRNYLRRTIFDRRPFRAIHLLNGNAPDPRQEAERYGRLLQENPLDVCLLGIGENGHIAFNDPTVARFDDPQLVKIVELEDVCRQQQVNDGCFSTIDEVPTHALTVTIPALVAARWMFCSVPAATKAQAVRRTIQGGIGEDCPATILRRHEHACFYTDSDAGRYLLRA